MSASDGSMAASASSNWFPPAIVRTCPNCGTTATLQFATATYLKHFQCQVCHYTSQGVALDQNMTPQALSELVETDKDLAELLSRQLALSSSSSHSSPTSQASTASSMPASLQNQPQHERLSAMSANAGMAAANPAIMRSAILTNASVHYTHSAHVVRGADKGHIRSSDAWFQPPVYSANSFSQQPRSETITQGTASGNVLRSSVWQGEQPSNEPYMDLDMEMDRS